MREERQSVRPRISKHKEKEVRRNREYLVNNAQLSLKGSFLGGCSWRVDGGPTTEGPEADPEELGLCPECM